MDRIRLKPPVASAAERTAPTRASLPVRSSAPEGWLRRAELLGHRITSVEPRRLQAKFWEKSGSSNTWHDEEPDPEVFELLDDEPHQAAPPLSDDAGGGTFPVYRRRQVVAADLPAQQGADESAPLLEEQDLSQAENPAESENPPLSSPEEPPPSRLRRLFGRVSSLVSQGAHVALDYAEAGIQALGRLQNRIPYIAAERLRASLLARRINLVNVADEQIIQAMGQVAQLMVGTLDRVEVPDLEVERGGVEISLSGLELSGIRWNYSIFPLSSLSVEVAQVRARRVAIRLPSGVSRVLALQADQVQSFGGTTLPALFLEGLFGYGLGYPGRVQQPPNLRSALNSEVAHAFTAAGLQLGELRVFDLTSQGSSLGSDAAPDDPIASLSTSLLLGQSGVPSSSRPPDLARTPVNVVVQGVELGADPEDAAYRLDQLHLALNETGSGSVVVKLTDSEGREQAALNLGVLDYRILLESIQLRASTTRLGNFFAQRFLANLRVSLEKGQAVLKFPGRKVGGLFTGALEQAQSALGPGLVASSSTIGEQQGAIDLARIIQASIPKLIEILRSPPSDDTSITVTGAQKPLDPFRLIEEYSGQPAPESGKDKEKEKEKGADPTAQASLLAGLLGNSKDESGLFDLESILQVKKAIPKEQLIKAASDEGYNYSWISGSRHLCYVRAIVTGLARRQLIPAEDIENLVTLLEASMGDLNLRYELEFIDAGGGTARWVRDSLVQYLVNQGILDEPIEIGIRIVQWDYTHGRLTDFLANDGGFEIALPYSPGHFDLLEE